MLKKILLSVSFVAFFAQMAFAQTGKITGKVTDSNGESIPGANVLLVENSRGAATNANGMYTINNVEPGTYTLRVSFVGFQTYSDKITVEPGETVTRNVQLKESAIGLDEVVVTGYQTQTKRELTGSISSVSSTDFEDLPVQNTAGILQGRAAGVQVTTTSGAPGGGFDVQVRGLGSITAGSNPLYIVDGVQMSNSGNSNLVDNSPLNGINPKDIKSIEVLKDAAAAAIYGSQAANGVVLITTKSGSSGKTQVTASIERGVRTYIQNNDYMDGPQWRQYMIRAGTNYFGSQSAGESYFRNNIMPIFGYSPSTDFNNLANTDWIGFVTRNGISDKYNMSISGGNDQTTFRISGGYENTQGQIKESDYQQYSIKSSISHKISDKFQTSVDVNLANNQYGGVCQDGYFINCPLSGATFNSPISKPYKDNGDYSPNLRFGLSGNPAVIFNEVNRKSGELKLLGHVKATYNFFPWLSLSTQLGMDYTNIHDKRYDTPVAAPTEGGHIFESWTQEANFTTNTTLNFSKSFNKVHNVTALLGGEYRRDWTRATSASGSGFPNRLFRVLDASASQHDVGGNLNEFRVAGYFTNLKYNYDQRYYISLTGRYDGSSRFGADKRWGFFPSASVGWRISEEDFFNADFVNDLKLRASYGVTGNSEIGYYAARGLYNVQGSYGGVSALNPNQLANPVLTWESAHEIDLGLDYSLFNNRLTGSIDVYQRDNKDLLLNSPLPIDSGYGSITKNVGHVRNQGFEFSLKSVTVDAGDFRWNTRFNFSVSKNTVKSLANGNDMLNPGSSTPIAVGHSIRAYHIPIWAGVNPADGRPMWYDKNGNITYHPVNADRKWFDGGEQDVIGGFGNTFHYKGLSLDVFFQYSFGQTASPQQVFYFGMAQVGSSLTNGLTKVLTDSWQQPGDMVGIPYNKLGPSTYPGTDYYSQGASNAFYDASYIRLKNATLSYTLPTSLVSRLNISNVRLYVTGLNLVTWTSYIGYDPEVAGSFTQASYPAARQISGGIEVKF